MFLDVIIRKVIQIAGVSLLERRYYNFVAGATAVDNPATGATDITVAGGMTAADKTKLDGIQKQGAAIALGGLAIDWSLGQTFTKTLASGGNTFTFSNAASGMTIIVRLSSHASGSTVTWPTVRWTGGVAPTQSTPSKNDVYTFVHDGSNIYGSVVPDMH